MLDTREPRRLARFYAELIGAKVVTEDLASWRSGVALTVSGVDANASKQYRYGGRPKVLSGQYGRLDAAERLCRRAHSQPLQLLALTAGAVEQFVQAAACQRCADEQAVHQDRC